jgi:hypothetical protein
MTREITGSEKERKLNKNVNNWGQKQKRKGISKQTTDCCVRKLHHTHNTPHLTEFA